MENPAKVVTNSHNLVTEEEVRKTLLADKGEDALLTSWKIVDFTKQGDNYACFVTSVEVKYSKANKEDDVTYVVKLNPCRSFEGFNEELKVLFLKEVRFYLDILPELNAALAECGKEPLRLPRCFHAILKSGKEQIYFEDLRARDFKMFDRRKGMDESHTTFVIKELARLHAASYLLQAKTPTEPLEVKYDFLQRDWLSFTENSREVMVPVLRGNVQNSVKMLRKVGYDEKAISWVENLEQEMEDLLGTGLQSGKFGVVGHGDCWNNNVLFRYNEEGDPVEVMLLDLQICRKASLAVDLNYFLYTSLTGSVRGPNINNFMSIYHSTYKVIIEAGGMDMYFTQEELLKEFRDKNNIGALFAMVVIPFLLLESDEVPDLSGEKQNLTETMDEVRAKAMDMLDSNPILKPRFLSVFDELMETGLIS